MPCLIYWWLRWYFDIDDDDAIDDTPPLEIIFFHWCFHIDLFLFLWFSFDFSFFLIFWFHADTPPPPIDAAFSSISRFRELTMLLIFMLGCWCYHYLRSIANTRHADDYLPPLAASQPPFRRRFIFADAIMHAIDDYYFFLSPLLTYFDILIDWFADVLMLLLMTFIDDCHRRYADDADRYAAILLIFIYWLMLMLSFLSSDTIIFAAAADIFAAYLLWWYLMLMMPLMPLSFFFFYAACHY